MGPFAGRADNMVKLRGVNVWPEAIGEIALDDPGLETDYFVRATREGHRDEMTIHVVSRAGEVAVFIPADPLAHSTPWFTGWSGLPSMKRISPSRKCTRMPQRHAHM